ncbi:MAG: hypothetical protein BWY76_02194 [bacterium ADurb.Bin429]|nr:MAG: hypothetical protein BWY76_02194 [bacterium ADurb.Bin429]
MVAHLSVRRVNHNRIRQRGEGGFHLRRLRLNLLAQHDDGRNVRVGTHDPLEHAIAAENGRRRHRRPDHRAVMAFEEERLAGDSLAARSAGAGGVIGAQGRAIRQKCRQTEPVGMHGILRIEQSTVQQLPRRRIVEEDFTIRIVDNQPVGHGGDGGVEFGDTMFQLPAQLNNWRDVRVIRDGPEYAAIRRMKRSGAGG